LRGRVFSAFAVSRDVVFLTGMALAGLADVLPIRWLVIGSAIILIGAGVLTQFLPGLGTPAAEWRRAAQLLRTAPSAPGVAVGRPALLSDLERLIGLLPALAVLDGKRRGDFIGRATVRAAPSGTAIIREGETGDTAFFVLDGHAVAGVPAADGNYRSLSTMGPGDFFGEIAALTGSRRTANVVADADTTVLEVPAAALRSIMDIPTVSSLILSKLTERLTRTANADLVRLAGLDQRDLKDLRRPRKPALPKTDGEAGAERADARSRGLRSRRSPRSALGGPLEARQVDEDDRVAFMADQAACGEVAEQAVHRLPGPADHASELGLRVRPRQARRAVRVDRQAGGLAKEVAGKPGRQVEELQIVDMIGRRADLDGQRGQERSPQVGVAIDELEEHLAPKHERLSGAHGHRRCGTRRAVEERQAAEEVAWPERGKDRRVLALRGRQDDLHAAGQDHMERIARIVLVEDRLARPIAARPHRSTQIVEHRVGHAGEERAGTEDVSIGSACVDVESHRPEA